MLVRAPHSTTFLLVAKKGEGHNDLDLLEISYSIKCFCEIGFYCDHCYSINCLTFEVRNRLVVAELIDNVIHLVANDVIGSGPIGSPALT